MLSRSLLLTLLCLAATPALALEVHLEVGLGGVVPTGGWVPVAVRCALGVDEAPLEGWIVFDRPSFAVSAYTAPVVLAPGEETVVRMTVPAGLGRDYQVRVERADGTTVAEASPSGSWRSQDPAQRLALLLGKRGLAALSGKGKDRPRVSRLGPNELPRDRRSLGFVSAVFVSGDPALGFAEACDDERVVDTLRGYVEEGGRLVFLARPGTPPPWAGTRLEALLPVREGEPRSVPTSALVGVAGEMQPGQVAVQGASLLPGARWIHRGGDVGLLAERALGQGSCSFVAFDVDADPARRGSKLVASLSGLAPLRSQNPRLVQGRIMEDLAFDAFQGRRALGPLAFACLATALLFHVLVLGPLPGLLKRRGPWVAMALPPLISLTIGLVILSVAALARGGGEVRGLSLVFHDPSAAQGGHTHLELGLFAGAGTEFGLDLPPGFEPTLMERSPLDQLSFRSPGPRLLAQEGKRPRLGPISVPSGGFTQVRLVGKASRGPRLQVSEEGGRLRIRSLETERTLEGLFAFRVGVPPGPGRLESIPPLAPGAEWSWAPAEAPAALTDQTVDGDVFGADPATCAPLLHRIGERLTAEYLRAPGAAPSGRDFPALWAGQLRRAALPLVVEEGGEPLSADSTSAIEVHLIPAEERP